jgi:cathepsin L
MFLNLQQPPDFDMVEVSELPESVDWSSKMSKAPNQGGCGDCWAFAATACVETALAIAEDGDVVKLSEENMFECSPDPQQCGGTGKCEGSIPELGWNYIADITAKKTGGMYTLEDLPYEAMDKNCQGMTDNLTPVVGLTGWTLLPTNDYKATMNAVAKVGPLALAVAANEWSMYESGVFSGESATVNHAVTLAGYGVDDTTGEKYYLIRNSWGESFGEDGYIRVIRTDDDDSNCKMDESPLEGITCALDENGNEKTEIPPETVCGTNAILYDASYPVGVHRL